MSQLNIHLTAAFAKDLQQFMKLRHIQTKTEAIRTAIHEGLERVTLQTKRVDFSTWLGLAKQIPINKKAKFHSDDDLWE